MRHLYAIFFGCFLLILSSSNAFTSEKKAQLIFPEITVEPGQEFKYPIVLDNVPNMAGIKLALTYENNLLTYTRSEKTKTTASLMHIVNDKKPGKLVIVMAGARGVPVNNQSVMDLYFKVNSPIPETVDTKFKVIEIQLMSDTLKELAYEFNISPVHIKGFPSSETQKNISTTTNQQQNIAKTSATNAEKIVSPTISKSSLSEPKKITPKSIPQKTLK